MEVVVTPKFHVELPPSVRQALGIEAGQRLQVFVYEGRIELVPTKPMEAMRGFLKGIDTSIERDDDRI
ncbi:MAG: AbrB/MazE/SpoVT family DNA-binding domain-containing protein [Candidatus Hydrogenedentes bacterium]|nr:AbrB/MazE/SpoVT family DNA-binding domain-containing protein [Candidatus Hydrogenedentota bacterium]